MNLNDLRMSLKAALDNMWARIDARITAIEQGGGGGGVTGVKGNAEASYRQGNVNLTPANIGAVSTSDVIDITHGGTGATDAALHIENDYSSVLNVINAVRNTRIFPISVQKSGTALYSDMPTTNQTDEWNLLLIGNSTRITATLYLFAKGSGRHIYVRDFYNGSWFDSQWTQIH